MKEHVQEYQQIYDTYHSTSLYMVKMVKLYEVWLSKKWSIRIRNKIIDSTLHNIVDNAFTDEKGRCIPMFEMLVTDKIKISASYSQFNIIEEN